MKRVDYRNVRGFEERIQLRYKIAEIFRLYLKYSVLGNKVGKVTAYLYFLIKKSGGKIAFQRSVYLLLVQYAHTVAAVGGSSTGAEPCVVGRNVKRLFIILPHRTAVALYEHRHTALLV